MVCDGCGEACLEDVELIGGGNDGPVRAYVVCQRREDVGRVAVPLERLQRWAVDLHALTGLVADGLGTAGGAEEVAAGRLWWLGKVMFRAGRADAFLARGAGRGDADEVVAANPRLRQCSRAVVLTLSDVPPDWLPSRVCLSLRRVLAIEGGALTLDRACIEEEAARWLGRSVFSGSRFPTPPGTTWEQVTITILADGDAAQVTAGDITEPVTPDQMGMAYARNPAKFTEDWKTLLRLSAHGRVTTEDPEVQFITPKRVERLKKKLRQFFGIDEDSFKPYRQVESDDSDSAERSLLDGRSPNRRRFVGGYEPRFVLTRIRP